MIQSVTESYMKGGGGGVWIAVDDCFLSSLKIGQSRSKRTIFQVCGRPIISFKTGGEYYLSLTAGFNTISGC